jgi:GNAT superfamily N-acetyltransferase
MPSVLAQAQSAVEYAAAGALFLEYAAGLGVDLGFQGFATELNQLPAMYGPPNGCLLLARSDDQFVGCVGVRRWSTDQCEMKRLYVRDGARGGGLGRALVMAAIESARSMAYRRMLLDTLGGMRAARALYSALGFREIEPYCYNPIAGAVFMALELGVDSAGSSS